MSPSRLAWGGGAPLTAAAVVVHQDDFSEQVGGGPLDNRVYGAQQHRQRLVHEDEDDAELGQLRGIQEVPAADGGTEREKEWRTWAMVDFVTFLESLFMHGYV